MCIWLPRWPLQRLAAALAELRSTPVVLYEAPGSGGLKVVDFSFCLGERHALRPAGSVAQAARPTAGPSKRQARTRPRVPGIRPGMPLAEATALADWALSKARQHERASQQKRAPRKPAAARERAEKKIASVPSENTAPVRLHLELHDPEADRLALEELAQWCQRFSPLVGPEQGECPESLLLDVSGLEALFGGEASLTAEVYLAFAQRGLEVRIAVADTIGAAWAVAHFGPARPTIARVPAGASLAALAPLPVESLRVPAESAALLRQLGIRRVQQLAVLERSALLSRFGPEVLERLDQATGKAAEVIGACPLPPELEHSWSFEYPTERREAINHVLTELIARLSGFLGGQRRGVLELVCRFEFEEGQPLSVPVGLFRASATAVHLVELVDLRLERIRFPHPVTKVCIKATAIGPLEFYQQALFPERFDTQTPRHLAMLVDRLSSRLGREAVLRPKLLADAQPEYACQYLPLASAGRERRRRRAKTKAPRETCGPCQRPLRLWRDPLPLDVVAVAPDGPPVQFHYGGREQRIACTWGPERIETGWWRSWCVRRDYYRVETAAGNRYWLFRRLQDGRWFLQGEFA